MARRAEVSARPQRTCVGCRVRTDVADLLRVVAIEGACVPDPRRRLPGRGAHLHPDLGCLDRAEQRRAFARALRQQSPPDTSGLRRYVEEHGQHAPASQPEAGRDDECAMSTQR